jgi:hypothetical protein
VDSQLRERRRDFRRRRDALERIQVAAGDLEQRLSELESQDRRLQQLGQRFGLLMEALREQATADLTDDEASVDVPLALKLA